MAMMLSGVMMLRHLKESDAADRMERRHRATSSARADR